MAIERLNSAPLTEDAFIPFYSAALGSDARTTVPELLAQIDKAYEGAAFSAATQYAAPNATGFTINVTPPSPGFNVFLLITPISTLAAGTIFMPANPVDRQEVFAHCTTLITALTINGNGSNLSGAPTTIAAGGFFRMRYDKVLGTWYRIG